MDKEVISKFVELAKINNCHLIFNVSGVTFRGLPVTDEIIEERKYNNWYPNSSSVGKTLMLYNVRKIISPNTYDSYEVMFFDYSKIDSITLSLFEQADD